MMKQGVLVGLLLSLTFPARAELISLDTFIAAIEKGGDEGCSPKAPLSDFIQQLVDRYSFSPARRRLITEVIIPQQFAGAIGKARAERYEDYTRIRVPLVGVYRGLRTLELAVETGHENGTDITSILFDASKARVEAVFGEDVARTRDAHGVLRVTSRSRGVELMCNTST